MYTIRKEEKNEIVIKNSKFIGISRKITSSDEFSKIVEEIKKEYRGATHYCYAYTLNNYKKASDDKEPSGTAGVPILNAIEKNNLVNTLVVVVRYFGGIKLGPGGLMRAYSEAAREVLEKSNVTELVEGLKIEIITDYDKQQSLDYLLKDSKIIEKEFSDKVIYKVLINKDDLDKLGGYNPKILEDIYIEKK